MYGVERRAPTTYQVSLFIRIFIERDIIVVITYDARRRRRLSEQNEKKKKKTIFCRLINARIFSVVVDFIKKKKIIRNK